HNLMKRLYAAIASAALLLPACYIPDQINSLQREQKTLQSQSVASRSEVDAVRANLADTRANLDQLHREVNALKEKVEEVRYQFDRRIGQVGQSSRDGDQRVKDLENRLAKVTEELKSQAAQLKTRDEELRKLRADMQTMATETASVRAANEAREKAAAESASARRDYEEALRLVDRKEYATAIPKLKDFLRRNPNGDLSDNAQYWLGECYYATKYYEQAILAFDEVNRKWPRGDKAPAALLKQSFAFAELGDKTQARSGLQDLLSRYPQSEEASKARQRLKTLDSPSSKTPSAGR